jgi:hypothetical protein
VVCLGLRLGHELIDPEATSPPQGNHAVSWTCSWLNQGR